MSDLIAPAAHARSTATRHSAKILHRFVDRSVHYSTASGPHDVAPFLQRATTVATATVRCRSGATLAPRSMLHVRRIFMFRRGGSYYFISVVSPERATRADPEKTFRTQFSVARRDLRARHGTQPAVQKSTGLGLRSGLRTFVEVRPGGRTIALPLARRTRDSSAPDRRCARCEVLNPSRHAVSTCTCLQSGTRLAPTTSGGLPGHASSLGQACQTTSQKKLSRTGN